MALWEYEAFQTTERRNREAIIGRLRGLPLFDVSTGGAVSVAPKRSGSTLTAAAAPYYTAPATVGSVVQLCSIILKNTHASTNLAVSVHLVPAAGSPAIANKIWHGTVYAGERVVMTAPWFLGPGWTVQALAGTTGLVTIALDALEYDAMPVGLTLKVINGVALAGAEASFYTVPASGVTHAVLLASTFCNTDIVSRTPTVFREPSGSASGGNEEIIVGDPIEAGGTLIDDTPLILMPGDFLAGLASAASVVSAHFTVLEAQ